MKTCTLHVRDYTNCLFSGLDEKTAGACKNHLTFWSPNFRFSPQYKLGRWDGKISLWKKGWTNNSLVDNDILDTIEEAGYQIDLVDDRAFPEIDIPLVTEDDVFGEVQLRDYQVAAVNSVLRVVNNPWDSWGNGVLKMATGAGKSYVCGVISKLLSPFGRVLVIVPNVSLVTQTAESFRRAGINEVGEFCGEKKVVHNVTITTWQSLDNYPELLAEVMCVIVDEAHQVKANVLYDLMMGPGKNVPFRFGCTGSLPGDSLGDTQVKAALGGVLYEMAAWQLQEAGVLSSCMITALQTQENRVFQDHPEEHKFLTIDKTRLKWLADTIRETAKTGNTLVLVKNVKTGQMLAEMIGEKAVFLSGTTKTAKREEHYKSVGFADGLILVCTDGIAAVGLDLPRIFNLFVFELGKSFVKIIQSIGRGLRRAEDKDHVNVFDVCADTKYSKRHLSMRKRYYNEARYPFVLKKVNYRHADIE